MNNDNCVELFIDVQCAYNDGSTKMFHLADSSMSFVSELQRDLLKRFTNLFA